MLNKHSTQMTWIQPTKPHYQLHEGHKNKTTEQNMVDSQSGWIEVTEVVLNQDIFSWACNQDVVSMVFSSCYV